MKSCESKLSVALYILNKELLEKKAELESIKRKKLSFSNLKVFFSYLRNGAFSRIFRRVFYKKNRHRIHNGYNLKSYSAFPKAKVVVYTCIWGGYDNILEPLFVNPNIDYRIITDQEIPKESVWKKQEIPCNIDLVNKTPTEINRLFKMKPHLLFQNYDYSIYIDGNIRVITDMMPIISDCEGYFLSIHDYQVDCIYNMQSAIIAGSKAKRKNVKLQMRKYRKEGFPKRFGAFECNVLVRKHNDLICIKLMNDWYDEFVQSPSKRDQLSLPYVIWKNHLTKSVVHSLGYHVRENPRFQVCSHRENV